MFTAGLLIVARAWNQPRFLSADGWIKNVVMHLTLSDKPMKDCICSLPDFIKGKEIKITDSIYRMSLGLKNGLAGYGLNLMNI